MMPAYIDVPDVDAFVEGASGEKSAVGAEGDAVDGLGVSFEGLLALARLHVPQTHCRVETRTETQSKKQIKVSSEAIFRFSSGKGWAT